MGGFEKVLVPVDFDDDGVSDATREAVKLGAKLAGAGTLRLFHVTPAMLPATTYAGPAGIPADVIEKLQTQAETAALAVLGRVRDEVGLDAQPELVARHGDSLSLVLEEAEQWGADLIVIATSGRSRVARFFLGSTADRVIRQAACPVLAVPAAKED